MTKSVCLTIPFVAPASVKEITPTADHMGLLNTVESMLYGFQGSPNAKAPFLNGAYMMAEGSGAIGSKSGNTFYFVDLVYQAPASFDAKILYGQLQVDMLDKTPFLMVKRMSSDCSVELGKLWFEWAKEKYGQKKILTADVDWTNEMSYLPAFPMLVENLFKTFSQLHCVVMPMYTTAGAGSNAAHLCWVGVSPKEKARKWVADADVRMKPDVRVNLKF